MNAIRARIERLEAATARARYGAMSDQELVNEVYRMLPEGERTEFLDVNATWLKSHGCYRPDGGRQGRGACSP